MVNFKLRRRKNDGRKKQESGYTLEYKLEAGGKVDQNNPTQFVSCLAASRYRNSRPTPLKQEDNLSGHSAPTRNGLPNELALAGITDRAAANRYLREIHIPAFNAKFACPAQEQGTAFVP